MSDYVAQTGAPQVLGRNPHTAQMATQCDFNGRDLTALDRKPGDPLDQPAGSGRDRQRATRYSGRSVAARYNFDCAWVGPVTGQKQRAGQPDRTRTADLNLSRHERDVLPSAMSASMASAAVGTSAVRISQPAWVTKASSSIRIPTS